MNFRNRPSERQVAVALGLAAMVSLLTVGPHGSAQTARARPHQDSARVAAVVAKFHNALASSDSISALALLAPDAIILESGGMETRGEYRSHHLPGDIRFARAVKSMRGPIKVIVSGSTAWTASTSTTEGTFNGRAINSVGAESMVLTKTASGWRIRSIHWSSRNRRPPAAAAGSQR